MAVTNFSVKCFGINKYQRIMKITGLEKKLQTMEGRVAIAPYKTRCMRDFSPNCELQPSFEELKDRERVRERMHSFYKVTCKYYFPINYHLFV